MDEYDENCECNQQNVVSNEHQPRYNNKPNNLHFHEAVAANNCWFRQWFDNWCQNVPHL